MWGHLLKVVAVGLRDKGLVWLINSNNNNSHSHDNVYGAVVVAIYCDSSPGSFDE